MNVMDLAEWMTLHPAVRAESPTLFSALSLRSVLLWVSFAWALLSYPRWVRIAGVVLLAVALLPPIEFVFNPGDGNYQQLLLLAALTLVAGISALLLPQRWRSSPLIQWLIGGAFFLSTGYGLARGLGLMQSFMSDASLGVGALLVGLGVVALLGFGRPAHTSRERGTKNGTLR
ncbi:MAG: hypothetical protein IPK19_32530 [Chloroflexi bacterium]|nr:hypothetical protein [Chloroflexota bacterium]